MSFVFALACHIAASSVCIASACQAFDFGWAGGAAAGCGGGITAVDSAGGADALAGGVSCTCASLALAGAIGGGASAAAAACNAVAAGCGAGASKLVVATACGGCGGGSCKADAFSTAAAAAAACKAAGNSGVAVGRSCAPAGCEVAAFGSSNVHGRRSIC